MDPTRVKICGVARLEDAELAAELGAWAVGMIFYDGSPRRCEPAEAERICAALRRRTELAGVFVNATLDEIALSADRLGLTLVQLHGDEGPAFCGEVARRTGAAVIKALPIVNAGSLRDLDRFHTDYHLLDGSAADGRRGGTGTAFDWTLTRGRRSSVPAIVSGGLSAANVGEAIAASSPFAVDVASGVEARPGVKDTARMRDFFDAVTAAVPAGAGGARP